jgi:hypothetical protein
MTAQERAAIQQAIADICAARLCEVNSMSSRQEMLRLMIQATDGLRAALEQPEQADWQHLKRYGYAPGNYMSKCHSCGDVPVMDKRATTCRPCAEAMHAAALEQPEPRNQCGETCERAKLCATCARELTQEPCNIATDGVCEALECCNVRTSALCPEQVRAQPEQEWLTGCPNCGMDGGCDCEALEQPEQEPVAYWHKPNQEDEEFIHAQAVNGKCPDCVPLYTHPHRREWRGLAEEEIIDAVRESDLDWHQGWTLEYGTPNRYAQLARAVKTALKERNA